MRHLAEQKKRFGRTHARTHARTDTFFFTLSKNKATLRVAKQIYIGDCLLVNGKIISQK